MAQAVLVPIVGARARMLAPVVTVVMAFFIVAHDQLGIAVPGWVLAADWVCWACTAALAIAFMRGRVPERFIPIASAGTLWAPTITTLLPLYATGNEKLVILLVVAIAFACVLMSTALVVATIVATVALAIVGLALSGASDLALDVSALGTAAAFAVLTHALVRRALVREATTAARLAHELDEHRRLHEQLSHAQRMEAMGTLSAGIAHDMNNVLASITSFATLLAEAQRAPSEEVAQILAQAERGAALTRGLLAFSRRGQYRKQVVRIGHVIRDVLPLLARTLPKSITIRDELAFGDRCVEADPAHLAQVLVNLGVNAADAMNGAGVLTIAGDVVGDRARLRVSDTGHGMDEATRRRVFEPFFTTKPIGRGTGLGLSTAWGIVEAHGGAIEVASELGRGTTFTVWLPITSALPHEPAKPASTGPIAAVRRVLVVDDEPAVRTSAQRLLQRIGIAVEVACDGADALRVFDARGGEFDVVVLDMGMPVMNGAECFLRLRERSAVPVLIATGYADDHTLQELVAAGASIIEKPYQADELRREVARLLEGASRAA